MAAITAQMVKDLREKTGAGMMDCKNALNETSGDFEKAVDFLRKKGLKNVSKRAEKVAAEGQVVSYLHPGGRIGVMLELNCETDFVGRGEDFTEIARDIAMHVAWSAPKYVSREEVPADIIEREKGVYMSQLLSGQEKMAEKILAGKLEKFYQEVCLLEQVDAKEVSGKKNIGDKLVELSAKVGEKVVLRRFIRFELGEGIEKVVVDFAADVAAAAQV